MVEGRLLQTDKRYSSLKQSQKERIAQRMYIEFRSFVLENDRLPKGEQSLPIVMAVMDRIDDAGVWIPTGEVWRHYDKHRKKMVRRLAKELESEGKEIPEYLRPVQDPATKKIVVEEISEQPSDMR